YSRVHWPYMFTEKRKSLRCQKFRKGRLRNPVEVGLKGSFTFRAFEQECALLVRPASIFDTASMIMGKCFPSEVRISKIFKTGKAPARCNWNRNEVHFHFVNFAELSVQKDYSI